MKKSTPAAKLAAQIKVDGGAEKFVKKLAPALKAQPKPNMERRA